MVVKKWSHVSVLEDINQFVPFIYLVQPFFMPINIDKHMVMVLWMIISELFASY